MRGISLRHISLPHLSRRRITTFRRRFLLVATHSLNGLLLPLVNALISLWVVRLASVQLWGEFVELLIVAQLGAHVLAWGNKEYLLRAFSLAPASIIEKWQNSLFTRLALFPLFVLVALLVVTPAQAFLLTLWTLGLVFCQSFDALITYHRAFLLALAVEVGATGVLLAGITVAGLPVATINAAGGGLTLETLLFLFTVVSIGKAVILGLALRRKTMLTSHIGRLPRLDLAYFGAALPFFLLGFSGMLQSRIDLYSVSFFLPEEALGQYQVFIGLMLYLQALANFILTPFVKSLYRLEHESNRRVSLRLLGIGLALVPPALFGVNWLLSEVYSIQLSPLYFVLGGLCVLPVYFYLPTIYSLYRAEREQMVLWINLAGAAFNFVLNLIFVPRMGAGGALLATTLVQWLLLASYVYIQGKYLQGKDKRDKDSQEKDRQEGDREAENFASMLP